jgi:hypothetical protein
MKKSNVTQVLVIVAVTVFGFAIARAQVETYPPPQNAAQGSNTDQSAVTAEIEAEQMAIEALLEQLAHLQDRLNDLKANQPQAPRREDWKDEDQYWAAFSQYQARMGEWQSLFGNLLREIRIIQAELVYHQDRLAALGFDLNQNAQPGSEGQRQTAEFQRPTATGLPQISQDSTIVARGLDPDLEFDEAIDEELADFLLEQESELSDVQTRGVPRTRSRVLSASAGRTSSTARQFKMKTEAAGLQAAVAHVEAVRLGARSDPKLVAMAIIQSLESHPDQDPMRAAFMVFRASIQQTNADKAYFLSKLQRYNQIGNALSDYLKQLNDAMGSGSGCSDEDSGSRNVDTSNLDPDHRTLADRMLVERAWVEGDDGILRTIRQLQQMEGQVRNRRQNASTAFQNFDQKANQLYNLLSSVMKAMNEMRMGTVRNML